MAIPYEFFDHTADIGATIYGATLPELFVNAARAMVAALGKFETAGSRREKVLRLDAPTPEDLLHDWLAELLFEFEVNHVLFAEIAFAELTPQQLLATVRGAVVDFTRSQPNEEIKAVTYHQLRVEQLPTGAWQAVVIFDV